MATISRWDDSPYGAATSNRTPQADQDARLLHHLLESLTREKVDVIRQNAMENYSFGGPDQWRIVFRQSGYNMMISYDPHMSKHMESIARDCAEKLKRYMVENDRVKIQGAYDAASTATEIAMKMHSAQGSIKAHQEKMNQFTKVLVDKNAKIALAPQTYRKELQARVDNWLQ